MRLDAYRIISAANRNTHILAIDYRGWGYSSGVPSEEGVITDGLTALNWAINTAGVDPSRVLLVGQSLGTAIATGVVTKYYEEQEGKPLAGLVLVAAFTSLRNVVGAYRMGGVLPLIGPLNVFPKAAEYLIHNFLRAEFNTAERIGRLARGTAGTNFSLTMVHALNDWEIPYQHSRDLFISAGAGDINIKETNSSSKVTREIEGGRIRHIETVWGGHNAIQKSEAVLKAILSAWRN
jgi:abhydrolase domain-containing protein 12